MKHFLLRLFRRRSPLLSDMPRALRQAARHATSEVQANQWLQDALALETIMRRVEDADKPSRDAMQVALGMAELGLSDRIASMMDIIRDTHLLVQDQESAALALSSLLQEISTSIDQQIDAVEVRLDVSETDRASLRTQVEQLEVTMRHDYIRLQESASRLMVLVDLTGDAVIAVDDTQTITWLNSAAVRLFHYDNTTELLGCSIDMLIPEEFRAAHHRHLDAFVHGVIQSRRMAERQEVYGLTRDGKRIRLHAAIAIQQHAGERSVMTVILRPGEDPGASPDDKAKA